MQNQEEIWKDVVGYEGLYQVSNMGRVRSLGHDKWHKGRIIKSHFDGKKHYKFVSLHKKGKSKRFNIHRLVAIAFVPNPNNYPQVNHKNEIKTDNRATNLEWCTAQYNINYGSAMKRAIKTRYSRYDVKELVAKTKASKIANKSYSAERPVNQFTWDGEFIKRYDSATQASKETGISGIGRCCQWKTKRAGKYIWVYDEDLTRINERLLFSHPNSKKVGQYDLCGNLIKVWNSCTEACQELGINPASLSECCNGNRKKTKGFIWKFIQ